MSAKQLWLWAVLGISAVLVACAGGGTLPNAPHTSGGGTWTSGGKLKPIKAHIVIHLPPKWHRKHRVKIGSHYISASTNSFKFVLNAVNGGAVPAGYTTTMTMNLASCTGTTTRTCATAWTVPAASDTFTVYEYSGTGGTGNILGENALTQTIATGSSSIAVTMYGVTNSIVVVAANTTYESGSSGSGFTVLGAATPWPFTVEALDASGNVIAGAGAPTISASPNGTTYTASVSSNTLFVTPKSTNGPISATAIKITVTYPSGGATPYPGTCDGVTGTSCSVSFNVSTVLPRAVAVVDTTTANVQIFSQQKVAQALAGEAAITASGSLSVGTGEPSSIAEDSSGNVYVGVVNGGNNIQVFSAGQVTSAINGSANVTKSGSLKCGGGTQIISVAVSPTKGTLWGQQWTSPSASGHAVICGYATTTMASAVAGTTLATPDATMADAFTSPSQPARVVGIGFGAGGGLYAIEDSSYLFCSGTCSTPAPGTLLNAWKATTVNSAITNGSTNVLGDGYYTISSTQANCDIASATPPPDGCGSGNIDPAYQGQLFSLGNSGTIAVMASPPPSGLGTAITGTLSIGTGYTAAGISDDGSNLFAGAYNGSAGIVYVYNSTLLTKALTGSHGVTPTGSFSLSGNTPLYCVAYESNTGSLFATVSHFVLAYYVDKVSAAEAGGTNETFSGYLNLGSSSDLAWQVLPL
jgi:hypothetical protein